MKKEEGKKRSKKGVGIDGNPINELNEKFELHPAEVHILTVECAVKKPIKKYGSLYVFQEHVCFESSVFGLKNLEVIDLLKVTKIEVVKEKLRFITEKGKKNGLY